MEPQTITLDPVTCFDSFGHELAGPVESALARAPAVAEASRLSAEAGRLGHVAWLREVIARWEGPLVRYAARVAGDLDLGRDVVQETFLRLCREERSVVGTHLARWLFTVCRSRALDVRRKESRMSLALDLDERTSPGEVAPDELLERRETTGRLMSLLEQLPDNQQAVILLKFQNELSYREIADITGHSVSNVGFLLHTGIKRLREMMKGDEEP